MIFDITTRTLEVIIEDDRDVEIISEELKPLLDYLEKQKEYKPYIILTPYISEEEDENTFHDYKA